MALKKWDKDRETTLKDVVGSEEPVSQETVKDAADVLETTTRSISSKLRKMGYDVELASTAKKQKYSDEQEAALKNLVSDNSGEFTYVDIAKVFEDGDFSPKSIQGKILSMELTSHVKKAEPKEVVKKYSDEEEVVFIRMSKDNAFAEDIAEALGRELQSVRGKGLSLLRAGSISEVPKQRNVVKKIDALTELGDISEKTVAEIAESIEKTERGVKTMLTRRGKICKDYNGEERKAKAAS